MIKIKTPTYAEITDFGIQIKDSLGNIVAHVFDPQHAEQIVDLLNYSEEDIEKLSTRLEDIKCQLSEITEGLSDAQA